MPKLPEFIVEEVDGINAFRRRLNNGAPVGYELHSWNVVWVNEYVYTLVFKKLP